MTAVRNAEPGTHNKKKTQKPLNNSAKSGDRLNVSQNPSACAAVSTAKSTACLRVNSIVTSPILALRCRFEASGSSLPAGRRAPSVAKPINREITNMVFQLAAISLLIRSISAEFARSSMTAAGCSFDGGRSNTPKGMIFCGIEVSPVCSTRNVLFSLILKLAD